MPQIMRIIPLSGGVPSSARRGGFADGVGLWAQQDYLLILSQNRVKDKVLTKNIKYVIMIVVHYK
jgi:hypothetical protein